MQPFKSKQAKLLLDMNYIFLRFGFKDISKEHLNKTALSNDYKLLSSIFIKNVVFAM